MQLRFLKGDWEFGKYKLQYIHPDGYWDDVPTVLGLETEKPVELPNKIKGNSLSLESETINQLIDYLAESQKEGKS